MITQKQYRALHLSRVIQYQKKELNNKWFGGNRELALERDGFKCCICGMSQQSHINKYGRDLTVDHIDGSGRNSTIKNNDLSNLRTLCLSCHGKEDIKRRNWRPVHKDPNANKTPETVFKDLIIK